MAFSKRSAEIDAAVSAGGHTSMRARGVAARDTRRAKRHTPVQDLMVRWQTELESLGYRRDGLRAAVDEGGLSQDRAGGGRFTAGELDLLVEQALASGGRLADMKVFTRADVVVALAPRVFGFDQSELLRAVAQVRAHRDAIPLVGVAHAREHAYAPACVIATEQAIAGLMECEAARMDSPAVLPAAAVNAMWAKEAELGHPLTVGQANAAAGIVTSGRGLDVVLGVAGSGKTTMLDAAGRRSRPPGARSSAPSPPARRPAPSARTRTWRRGRLRRCCGASTTSVSTWTIAPSSSSMKPRWSMTRRCCGC